MKGLTLDQFKEVVEFCQEHHAFGKYKSKEEREKRAKEFPYLGEYGFSIKYIDSCYDSRDMKIWSVTFRMSGVGVCLRTNHYNALNLPPEGFKYTDLYDLCMDFLKGLFVPTSEFLINEE